MFISGIGGQGIQLMGKVLALSAIAEDLFVQLTGEYGGAMRGGSTVASVVIGVERLRALPVVPEGGAALLMHDKFVDEAVLPKLRPGSLIVAEASIVDLLPDFGGHRLIAVPAKQIALEIDEFPLPLEPRGGVRCDPQLGQTFVFAARLPTLASGRHPGKLVDGHSRDYPGGFVWKEPGRGGSGAVRFEPVAPVTSRRSQDHPPWLELQFNAVVP